MAEGISFVREKIELINENLGFVWGNSIEARRKALKSFVGLGAPDYCVLTKTYEGTKIASLFTSKSAPVNFFHWVLGVTVTSASSIDAYFKELVAKQEQVSLGGMRGAYKINKCHYTCYNAFRKLDLNLELTSDGKSDCYTLDEQGKKSTDISSEFWEELAICTILRSLQPVPLIEPVYVRSVFTSFEKEKEFLDLVTTHFWKGHQLGSVDGAKPDNTNNLLATLVHNYFTHRNRQEQLIQFFSQFTKKDPSVTSHIAEVKLKSGQPDEALSLIEKPLREMPHCGSLVTIQVASLLQQESYQQARLIAEENLENNLDSVNYWLSFAEANAYCEEYKEALKAINKAPIKSAGSTDIIGNPPSMRLTEPAIDLQSHEIKQLDDFEFDREEGQEMLMTLHSLQLSDEEKRAYKILLYINKEAGWKRIVDDMKIFKKKAALLSKPTALQPISIVVEGTKQEEKEGETKKEEESKKEEPKKEEIKQESKEEEEPKKEETKEETKQEESKEEQEIKNEDQEDSKEKKQSEEIHLGSTNEEVLEPLSAHLENIFNSLNRDLRVLAKWKEVKDQSQVKNTHIPADYVRIGLLAIRLGDLEEAEKTFLRCVASQYHLEAWKQLLVVYHQQFKIRESILVIDHLLKHYGELYPTTLDPYPMTTKVLFDLVARHGLSKVRQVMNEITPSATSMWQMKNTGPLHLRIQNTLQETVTWGAVGSDK